MAIVLDGLQKLSTAYNGVIRQDAQTKAVKMQWIGSLMAQEKRYAANYCAAKDLSELYDSNDIYTYVRSRMAVMHINLEIRWLLLLNARWMLTITNTRCFRIKVWL